MEMHGCLRLDQNPRRVDRTTNVIGSIPFDALTLSAIMSPYFTSERCGARFVPSNEWPNPQRTNNWTVTTGKRVRRRLGALTPKIDVPEETREVTLQKAINLDIFLSNQSLYPPIDTSYPGVEVVHAEPPVLIVRKFLSQDECRMLIRSAKAEELREVEYGDKVLVDTYRLWPLGFVVLLGSVPTVVRSIENGNDILATFTSGATAVGLAATAVAVLTVAVRSLVDSLIQGKVFTGKKWVIDDDNTAFSGRPAYLSFLSRLTALLQTDNRTYFEPPLVTHYTKGEYQRVHTDARPSGDPDGLKEFLAAGGQRLVQCLVYLSDSSERRGGGTKFHHPVFKQLVVQPDKGDALLFFPSFFDGRIDHRMPHSGEELVEGEKWMINTWKCQFPVPSWDTESREVEC